MKRLLLASLLVASLVLSGPARADDYEWTGVSRIVSVGDIHGAYDNLVKILQNARLIDEELEWIGGTAHLVQNGDIVDRGPDSRKAMDLLMDLEKKAEKAGGRIHLLIGNHEAMNVVGILDLVSDEEYEAFVDRNSKKLSDKAFERAFGDIRTKARRAGKTPPLKQTAKQEFLEKYPLGFIEHRRAFDPKGRYGKWITRHPTAIKINGILFSHGDWSEKFSELDIEEVNETIRKELKGDLPLEGGMAFDEQSPLQYRGFANVSLTRAAQEVEAPRIQKVLDNLGATRMVVGHTLTAGVIESRFDGRHISLDVGMLDIYRGGHRIALEIVGDEIRAIHDEGTVPIPETMDETNFGDYIRNVAAVDPENLDVQLQLVDLLVEEERFDEIIPILENALTKADFVPFRYRDLLGKQYERRGEIARAEEHYLAYIQGLARLVESSPDNVNLANLLGRYAATKGLELDLAESVMKEAIEKAPESSNFRLTLVKVHLAQSRFDDALAVLGGRGATGEPDYETQLLTGLAHAGLGETDEARAAFESAIEVDPSRTEAREELEKLTSGR